MKLQTPRGVKDFLPEETYVKHVLEEKIRELQFQWGYQEVVTPTFEFCDTLTQGDSTFEQTYKFLDRDGNLLALRSDLTTPIARMAVSRYRNEPKPLRLAYLANVFRFDDVQIGFQREFFQAGVELIGSNMPAADGEIIALASEILGKVGVANYQFDIGQVQFFNGIMEQVACDESKKQVRQALLNQDFVKLKQILNTKDFPEETKSLLLDLPSLRGREDVLEQAYARTENATARQAIENLKDIYAALQAYGVADKVYIDLSMVKSLDYYTGMVLEGYAPNLGFSLCSGGRYDSLSSQFGMESPAVGFALGLERLMLILDKQGKKIKRNIDNILVISEDRKQAIEYASKKRQSGYSVEVDVQGYSIEQAKKYGKRKGIQQIVFINKGGNIKEITL